MRYVISILAALTLASPALAGHASGESPGKAAMDGADRNGDGRTNGQDYSPGQSAAEDGAADLDGNGSINGADYAPGQIRGRD